MNIDQIAISCILVITFILFVNGKWRYDIVALISLCTLVIFDKILGEEKSNLVIDISDIFNGFAHPAVITVAAVLIISQAMKNSGVVDLLARQIKPLTKNKEMHISSMSGIIAILSGLLFSKRIYSSLFGSKPITLRFSSNIFHLPCNPLLKPTSIKVILSLTIFLRCSFKLIIASFIKIYLVCRFQLFQRRCRHVT